MSISNSGFISEFSDNSSETLASTNGVSTTPSALPTPLPHENEAFVAPNLQKKRGRKGHTKSRRGCLNCKRARIKCKENHPACDHCAHRNMTCEWPDNMQPQAQRFSNGAMIRKAKSPAPIPMVPQDFRPVFNANDFRLFHYFIEKAYPHHPMGSDSVWQHEIPVIAHEHEYLLHAMLALSASELAEKDPNPVTSKALSCTAISHRVTAIARLNAAISAGLANFEQGNAMLATCFSLLFQSVLLEDGLLEYMTFIRGGVTVGYQMGMKGLRILFEKLFDQQDIPETLHNLMVEAPLVHPKLVRKALDSLERLEPLCQHPVEKEVYRMLHEIARSLITSSRDGYASLRHIYGYISWFAPQSSFAYLTNPANRVCMLLGAHFVAMQLTMTPITRNEWAAREDKTKERGNEGVTARWFASLHRDVPEEWLPYYSWTMWVEGEVAKGRVFNGLVEGEDDEGNASDTSEAEGQGIQWPCKGRK